MEAQEMIGPDYVNYKGYRIRPSPFPFQDGGYNLRVVIARHTGDKVTERPFTAEGHFDTQEEAYEAAIEFGMHIIDGKVEGLTVDNL